MQRNSRSQGRLFLSLVKWCLWYFQKFWFWWKMLTMKNIFFLQTFLLSYLKKYAEITVEKVMWQLNNWYLYAFMHVCMSPASVPQWPHSTSAININAKANKLGLDVDMIYVFKQNWFLELLQWSQMSPVHKYINHKYLCKSVVCECLHEEWSIVDTWNFQWMHREMIHHCTEVWSMAS